MTVARVLSVKRIPRGTVLVLQLTEGDVKSHPVLRSDDGAAVQIVTVAFGDVEAWKEGRRSVLTKDIGIRAVAVGDVLRSD